MPPFAHGDIQPDIHDAVAFQPVYLVAEVLGHTPDLPVQALGKDDSKRELVELFHETFFGDRPQDRNPVTHSLYKRFGDRALHGNQVLFLVVVPRPKNFVHDISVARQKDQALAIFIKPSDREDALGIVDVIHDVVLLPPGVGSANNTARFIESDIRVFALVFIRTSFSARFPSSRNQFPVQTNLVTWGDLATHLGNLAVDGDPALLDEFVGFPARAI